MPGHTTELPVTGPGTAGVPGLTAIIKGELVTDMGFGHVAFDVSVTVTWSPLDNEDEVKTGLLVPLLTPLTLH